MMELGLDLRDRPGIEELIMLVQPVQIPSSSALSFR